MKYGWYALLALLLPAGVVSADDSTFGRTATATVRVSLYIPAQFEASLVDEEICVRSTGASPYEIVAQDTLPSSPNHCIGTQEIPAHNGGPLTVWVRPE